MKVTMNYIGHSEYDYPSYKDNNGKIWLDTNYGNANWAISLYSSSSGDLSGEPNNAIGDIYPDAEIIFETTYKENPRKMDYMMLSRYQMDCNYFLGNGNGYVGHLYFGNVEKHIEEMKKLYNSFSEEEKPEWISMDDIEKYYTEMKAKLKEREE